MESHYNSGDKTEAYGKINGNRSFLLKNYARK